MSQILCLWSGPRNISTAMMRSFGNRADVTCWDEPFFAAFLERTGLDHPGRTETLAQCDPDADRVAAKLSEPVATKYHFQKHMAHHMLLGEPDALPMDWVAEARHVLLLRHPARVIASYAKGRPDFTDDDLGFRPLRNLYQELTVRTGRAPMVIDSDDILADPDASLRAICQDGFGIAFDPAMLEWPAGSRSEDGPWAPYWYKSVEASRRFSAPPRELPIIASAYAAIHERCLADYETLRALR